MRCVLILPSSPAEGSSVPDELALAAAAAGVLPLQLRAMELRPGDAGTVFFTAASASTAAVSFKVATAGRTEVSKKEKKKSNLNCYHCMHYVQI